MGVTSNTLTPYFSSDVAVGMSGSMYAGVSGTGIRAKTGDRVAILLDFKTDQIKFYWNGKEQSKGTLKSNTVYYPIIHMYYQNTSFTLSFPKQPKN